MSNPAGFTFREKMSGGFALGETDPHAGAAAGHAAGLTFTMHGKIEIQDLDRFLAEPDHPGSLSGSIDFAPLGSNLAATRGVFNLFSPTSDPSMKYMVYELGFAGGGKNCYMAGHKDVKQAPVTDLWKATTTLYTQLHEGTDKSDPVVGAGIISISMPDFLLMLASMHATNAASPAQAAAALARFGRFFLGELWDTYVHHTAG